MRKVFSILSAIILLQISQIAQAQYTNWGINVGGPPVVVSQPPDFLSPPELGFGVAVGVPYDLFYASGVYYLYRGGGWYRSSYYGGEWIKARKRDLPPELRRYSITRIHAYRDRDFREYSRDREHYRGQRFRPEIHRDEEHREMRGPVREERGGIREERPQRSEERREERGR
ncbi:hypothetical protein [Geomesophilobacter sediminis]|uniref:DUF3300 domain-containing protein n=1 Tax=Geomesophilobacter sediminis TaxID=2798584 RepID=A0A8J7LY67_9BACT|nr:hypothetical protein [Geomesophilobacter sediminis]MBJ6724177.1 hypothetical protein [Geomesophilobacter sediminis]